MGTHPIFESDFDCLTELAESERKKNVQLEKNKRERGLCEDEETLGLFYCLNIALPSSSASVTTRRTTKLTTTLLTARYPLCASAGLSWRTTSRSTAWSTAGTFQQCPRPKSNEQQTAISGAEV